MMRKRRALLGALTALSALAGCAEESTTRPAIGPGAYTALGAAALRTVGAPGAPDLPFGEALVAYSRRIARLHAWMGPRVDAEVQAAVLQLATVLERMPAASGQPALRRAAAMIRAEQARPEPEVGPVEQTKRSLAVAATALLDLAVDHYRGSEEIAARARRFGGTVQAIDPGLSPPDRAGVIEALIRAERVLAAMYAANVWLPRLPAPPER